MPLIDKEKLKAKVNCLNIILTYVHSIYLRKGFKTDVNQNVVQSCRTQCHCEGKLVQKTNEDGNKIILWSQISPRGDLFANRVFDMIRDSCTYGNLQKEFLKFDFENYTGINTVISCTVPVRNDGKYIYKRCGNIQKSYFGIQLF